LLPLTGEIVADKIPWHGRLTSVQPRIRLTRSSGDGSHSYLGYALRVDGTVGDKKREFWVGVGKVAHAKHRFEVGLVVSGVCHPATNPRQETVEFYKVSKLAVRKRVPGRRSPGPPSLGVPPDLAVYRARGHRRLDARVYEANCSSCVWGCRMTIETIIDHKNPSVRRYRTEPCCYGLKSCPRYRVGPERKVPGRQRTT
jgi:hypothetical protein